MTDSSLIPHHSSLVLIGFMGTGKSTVGKLCAERLGATFRDSDAVIEEREGCTVATLFAEHGEAVFREKERAVIQELAATPGLVIATGGGAVLDPENVKALHAGGRVVLLLATPDTILERVGDTQTRPLLASAPDPRAHIEALLAARLPFYERASHYRVDTTGRTPQEVAETILAWFAFPIRS